MITVIIPIHSYKFINNSLSNFLSQNYPDKELLLILNGEIKENLHLKSKYIYQKHINSNNIAQIRNAGLEWMDKNNRKIFSFFDSDDTYLPNYLTEAFCKLEQGYELVGKTDIQFEFENSKYRIEGSLDNKQINGPTMTGYLSEKLFDLKFYSMSEDIDFVCRHNKIGVTSSDNFIYNVRENSIQNRTFKCFITNLKHYNTLNNNTRFRIYKNEELYWKFGDEYDPMDIFKPSTTNPEDIFAKHRKMIRELQMSNCPSIRTN